MAFQTQIFSNSIAVYKSVCISKKYGILNMNSWHLTHKIEFYSNLLIYNLLQSFLQIFYGISNMG